MLPSKKFLLALLVLAAMGGGAYYYRGKLLPQPAAVAAYKTPEEADPYVRFDMEAYDLIEQNYWNQGSQSDLATLFKLSLQKAAGGDETLATTTRAGTAQMLAAAFAAATSTDAKKNLALNTLVVALYNLAPAGRDQLLSQAQETALRQDVSNINPATDLYADLGVQKGASQADIDAAYKAKAAALKNATSSAQQAQAKAIAYAHQVLSTKTSKTLYDNGGVEPTVFAHTLGHTLYLDISKISPTTLQEFGVAVDAASTTPNLNSMILDLRGNVGGAFSFLQEFLGLFIGNNQYAFDLYHQGTYDPQRTAVPRWGELARFGDIAILTDNMTQSTAEVTVAAFKRYHLAHVVGATTRGWGTVENTYPITTQIDSATSYSLLLVNSITLDDNNQPIESHGVAPDIDTGKPGWQNQLSNFFTSSSLIAALKQEATQPPLK